jgi:hypothetical protein
MTTYRFNMAREQVLTLEKRRLWFRWVLSYLAVAVVAIATVAYYLTVSVVDLSARNTAMDEAERRFLRQHPNVRSVDECLSKVSAELAGLAGALDAVAQFRATGKKPAAIVLGLAESLPQGMDLGKLTLDGGEAEGTVKVEVYVPSAMNKDGGLTLPNVIARWESSALLTNQVRQFTSENSTRVNFEGRDFLSWRFTGVLEGLTK